MTASASAAWRRSACGVPSLGSGAISSSRHRLDAAELERLDERVVAAPAPVVMLGDDGDPLHAEIDRVLHLGVALHPAREHGGEDARVHRIGEEEAVEAVITHGTPASTISGFAARLAFEHAPPWIMNTSCWWMSFLDRADCFGGLAAVVLADVLDHPAVTRGG